MPDIKDSNLALFELYLATAEKVSDRRAAANVWILSVNSALIAMYGYLAADKSIIVPPGQKSVWLWAIPAAGMITSLTWLAVLETYRQLNGAKFLVLQDLEKSLPAQPFATERMHYKAANRLAFAKVESAIPFCFFALYLVLIGAALLLP